MVLIVKPLLNYHFFIFLLHFIIQLPLIGLHLTALIISCVFAWSLSNLMCMINSPFTCGFMDKVSKNEYPVSGRCPSSNSCPDGCLLAGLHLPAHVEITASPHLSRRLSSPSSYFPVDHRGHLNLSICSTTVRNGGWAWSFFTQKSF